MQRFFFVFVLPLHRPSQYFKIHQLKTKSALWTDCSLAVCRLGPAATLAHRKASHPPPTPFQILSPCHPLTLSPQQTSNSIFIFHGNCTARRKASSSYCLYCLSTSSDVIGQAPRPSFCMDSGGQAYLQCWLLLLGLPFRGSWVHARDYGEGCVSWVEGMTLQSTMV